MSSSDITVAALTASPTLRGNKLAWTYSDPRNNALPNIGLDMVEVHASTTNDRTTATKVGEGITDFLHVGFVEEQIWYYWIKARDYIGSFGAWYPSSSTAGVSATSIGLAGVAFGLANCKLVATVAANALTIAIKTAAGNDPSASDPVFASFRSSTSANGNYVIRTLTSALSITIPSGATMGAVNSTPFRIWIVLIDDGGTLALGVVNCLVRSTRTIFSLKALATITGELVTTAADSAGVVYTTTTTVSVDPFRILGYMTWDSGLATVGTWASGPSVIQLAYNGMALPGDVLKSYVTEQLAYDSNSGTVNITSADTAPTISFGNAYFAIPTEANSPANVLDHSLILNCSCSVASPVAAWIIWDLTGNAKGACWGDVAAADKATQLILWHREFKTASSHAVSLYAGLQNAGSFSVNGTSAGRRMGGTLVSVFKIDELQG
jgi:hypothetical protein